MCVLSQTIFKLPYFLHDTLNFHIRGAYIILQNVEVEPIVLLKNEYPYTM